MNLSPQKIAAKVCEGEMVKGSPVQSLATRNKKEENLPLPLTSVGSNFSESEQKIILQNVARETPGVFTDHDLDLGKVSSVILYKLVVVGFSGSLAVF